jgi:hypothetical protein
MRMLPGLLATAAALAFLAAPPTVHAEDVRVTVVVILATDQNKNVDCDLECIAKEIQKNHPKLTGFHCEKVKDAKQIKIGDKADFDLVDDETATVTVRHGPDDKNRVGLTIKAPILGSIDYLTCCGKFLPVFTRYKTKDKEYLIIAVRVQPCKQQVAKP